MRSCTPQCAVLGAVLAVVLTIAGGAVADLKAGGLPVKRLDPVAYAGWTNAYRLANDHVNVVIAAESGRVVHLSVADGDNVLVASQDAVGQGNGGDTPRPWADAGGNWMWPVAQEQWIKATGVDWPPPEFLNERPWIGHAWRDDDDEMHCLVEQAYGAPLNIRVLRRFSLAADSPQLIVTQRIERTGESNIPVCLWNVSQVGTPDLVLLPVDPTSAFTNGYAGLLYPPTEGLTRLENNILKVQNVPGEFKIGSDSTRQWIAVQKGNTVIVTRAATHPEIAGDYPDGGCTLEVFGNDSVRQIETLSVQVPLPAGDRIENTVRISLHAVPNAETDQAVIDAVRAIVGEKK